MSLYPTKIIGTMGLWASDKKILRAVLKRGLSIARLNFSHGDHQLFEKIIKNIRSLEKEGFFCPILQDLQGPKIRIKEMRGDSIVLKKGDLVVISDKPVSQSPFICPDLRNCLNLDQPPPLVLIDDGKIKLKYKKKIKKRIYYEALQDGVVLPRKGLSFPGTRVPLAALSDKDYSDLIFGLKHNVDFVALSFVQNSYDIKLLRSIIKKEKKNTKIIAKIETQSALDQLDSILDESDGIMIARGDLSLETSYMKVAAIQDQLIKKAKAKRKFVVVATQMMESFLVYQSPSFSESRDIVRAVWQGSDCVMLSGETAVHTKPEEAVLAMKKIVEKNSSYSNKAALPRCALTLEENWLLSLIKWGESLSLPLVFRNLTLEQIPFVSSLLPQIPIYFFTNNPEEIRRYSIYYGVQAISERKTNKKIFYQNCIYSENCFSAQIQMMVPYELNKTS
jgi:pyruvate kinase